MLYITNEDLAYEKYMRLLEEDESVPEDDDTSMANSNDPAVQAYQQGLDEIKKIILTTGRKRYQKYKLDGGKDTFEMFKKNMETQLTNELEDDMKEQFGAVPGKETEKDFLRQIKMGIDNLNNNITSMMNGQNGDVPTDPNAPAPQDQPQEGDPNAQQEPQPQNEPNTQVPAPQDQPQGNSVDELVDQSPSKNSSQPMQEGLSYINETIYRNKMKKLFNEYFS